MILASFAVTNELELGHTIRFMELHFPINLKTEIVLFFINGKLIEAL